MIKMGLTKKTFVVKHFKKVPFQGRKIGGDTLAKTHKALLRRGKGNRVGPG